MEHDPVALYEPPVICPHRRAAGRNRHASPHPEWGVSTDRQTSQVQPPGIGRREVQVDPRASVAASRLGEGLPESCQKLCLAMPHAASCGLGSAGSLTWTDVVRRGMPHWYVWGPRSLHTAEATGSKPVTPTSTNRFPPASCGASCQQIASRSLGALLQTLWVVVRTRLADRYLLTRSVSVYVGCWRSLAIGPPT